MTESLRNMPRYIRNTDAFGWQGADGPDGPWRSITPPQSGTPWQAASPINDLRQASADVSGVQILSPAAQAVMDAYYKAPVDNKLSVAAALRTVAEQVGPSESLPPGYAYSAPAEMWHYEFKLKAQRQILAIADELEATSQFGES